MLGGSLLARYAGFLHYLPVSAFGCLWWVFACFLYHPLARYPANEQPPNGLRQRLAGCAEPDDFADVPANPLHAVLARATFVLQVRQR